MTNVISKHLLKCYCSFFLVLLPALILANAYVVNGLYHDSAIYYQWYQQSSLYFINTLNLLSSGQSLPILKTEPGIHLLYFAFNLVFGQLSEETFLYLSMISLSFVCYFSCSAFKRPPLFLIPFIMLSYFILSRQIYVFRSFISYCLLIFALSLARKKQIVLTLLIALLFHSSSLLIVIAFFIVKSSIRQYSLITKVRTSKTVLFIVFLSFISLVFFIQNPSSLLSLSGAELSDYFSPIDNLWWQQVIASMLALPLYFSYDPTSSSRAVAKKLGIYTLLFSIAVTPFFYQIGARISVPALILAPFLVSLPINQNSILTFTKIISFFAFAISFSLGLRLLLLLSNGELA